MGGAIQVGGVVCVVFPSYQLWLTQLETKRILNKGGNIVYVSDLLRVVSSPHVIRAALPVVDTSTNVVISVAMSPGCTLDIIRDYPQVFAGATARQVLLANTTNPQIVLYLLENEKRVTVLEQGVNRWRLPDSVYSNILERVNEKHLPKLLRVAPLYPAELTKAAGLRVKTTDREQYWSWLVNGGHKAFSSQELLELLEDGAACGDDTDMLYVVIMLRPDVWLGVAQSTNPDLHSLAYALDLPYEVVEELVERIDLDNNLANMVWVGNLVTRPDLDDRLYDRLRSQLLKGRGSFYPINLPPVGGRVVPKMPLKDCTDPKVVAGWLHMLNRLGLYQWWSVVQELEANPVLRNDPDIRMWLLQNRYGHSDVTHLLVTPQFVNYMRELSEDGSVPESYTAQNSLPDLIPTEPSQAKPLEDLVTNPNVEDYASIAAVRVYSPNAIPVERYFSNGLYVYLVKELGDGTSAESAARWHSLFTLWDRWERPLLDLVATAKAVTS